MTDHHQAMRGSVVVDYKEHDGFHVFTSEDLPGLYVAHRDMGVAFHDLPDSIQKLIRLDEGIECEVTHEMAFSEFLKHLRGAAAEPTPSPSFLHMFKARFAVSACA